MIIDIAFTQPSKKKPDIIALPRCYPEVVVPRLDKLATELSNYSTAVKFPNLEIEYGEEDLELIRIGITVSSACVKRKRVGIRGLKEGIWSVNKHFTNLDLYKESQEYGNYSVDIKDEIINPILDSLSKRAAESIKNFIVDIISFEDIMHRNLYAVYCRHYLAMKQLGWL